LNPIRDIQVLCPMNRGGVGARSLNLELQAALNPAGEQKIDRFGWTFAAGDKYDIGEGRPCGRIDGRRAEFLIALAYATDLATGQPRNFALRA